MQLEYAALDAAVLVHIFGHVRGHSQPADGEGQGKLEWKSCIVSEDTESFSDRGCICLLLLMKSAFTHCIFFINHSFLV